MNAPFDPELGSAAVYFFVVPVYAVLWWQHRHRCYAALAIAALILALCAVLKSEPVRAWNPPPLYHHLAPKSGPGPSCDFLLIASGDGPWMPGSGRDARA
jgi:hypothetical protein